MGVLNVQGKGRVSAEPDLVYLSFAVVEKNRDYAECLKELNRRTEDLRSALERAGLQRALLKTSNFNLQVENQYVEGRSLFDGYSGSHTLRIELPAEKDLINKAFREIARSESGAQVRVSYSVQDQDALRQRALEEGVRLAKANAATLAAAAGVKLGKISHIDYGWSEIRVYEGDDDEETSVRSVSMVGAEPDIEPQDVTGEATVTMAFEILD